MARRSYTPPKRTPGGRRPSEPPDAWDSERVATFVRRLCALVADLDVDKVEVTTELVEEPHGTVRLFWVHLPDRRYRGQLIGEGGRVARDLRSLLRVWANGVGIDVDTIDANIHQG
jgi:predicted RNA-binding protein YlqC (UPF0109 family)